MTDQLPVLVVDLDGTLLRTDLLHETFWSAFSRDWLTPIKAARALWSGKPSLKSYLYTVATVDITSLPYNDTVINYILSHRERGGHTALVTASNHKLATQVGDHLDLFDETHGSDEKDNLKGQRKADFLSQHFSDQGYIYLGDAKADLPVWQSATKAVTLDVQGALKKTVEQINPNTEHLSSNTATRDDYLKVIRPHQWLKNLLVFLPMLAAHQLELPTLVNSVLAFLAFSFVASSVYIVNDLLDLNADRAHPRKRTRAFAAGNIPLQHGAFMAGGLLAVGFAIAYWLLPSFLVGLLIYYALTSAYSLDLKRRSVIDICTLAGLYTLRIIGGGIATGIELSFWLLAFSIFIFLSLAAVKRQAELIDLKTRGFLNIKGRGYGVDDLPLITMIALCSGLTSVLIIALYVNAPQVSALYPTTAPLWGVCCVLLYWLLRVIFKTHRGEMHDDPILFAIKDRTSRLCFVLIGTLIIIGAIP